MGGGPINGFHIDLAVRTLDEGGIVVHATEGVWGLACDPFDRVAVAKLLDLSRCALSRLQCLLPNLGLFGSQLGLPY